jgi:hypothetical protein
MADVSYDFTISTAFPNGKVDPARLTNEVRASAIVVALSGVNTLEDVCSVVFKDVLTSGDQSTLASLVTAHSGEPLPGPALDEDGIPITVVKTSKEDDGRQIVTVSPAGVGWKTWFTGAGDGVGGRGLGQPMRVTFDGTESFPATKTQGFSFAEMVEIHDGQVCWGPAGAWSHEDRFHLGAHIPANVPTPNGSGTGNINLYPVGPGRNLLLPAAGNGTHDLDLGSAIPTPAHADGWWNVDPDTGAVSPGDGTTWWTMYDFPMDVWFVRALYMGNPLCVWDIDVYRTEKFHPTWTFNIVVDKVTPGAGWMAGWLYVFRLKVY